MYFIARKKEKKTDRQKERDLYGGREGERDEEIERETGGRGLCLIISILLCWVNLIYFYNKLFFIFFYI